MCERESSCLYAWCLSLHVCMCDSAIPVFFFVHVCKHVSSQENGHIPVFLVVFARRAFVRLNIHSLCFGTIELSATCNIKHASLLMLFPAGPRYETMQQCQRPELPNFTQTPPQHLSGCCRIVQHKRVSPISRQREKVSAPGEGGSGGGGVDVNVSQLAASFWCVCSPSRILDVSV